jgi:hypothetical protein
VVYHSKTGKETRKMENTKDQYIGAEIHSARSVNPDGETVTLDGDTVVWTGEEDVLTPEELEESEQQKEAATPNSKITV